MVRKCREKIRVKICNITNKEDALAFLSVINLGEIIYTVGRRLGNEAASGILHDVLLLPIKLAEVTLDRVLASAQIKAHHAVSYADAFAVTLAQELNAAVVTGDLEFKQVEALVNLIWL